TSPAVSQSVRNRSADTRSTSVSLESDPEVLRAAMRELPPGQNSPCSSQRTQLPPRAKEVCSSAAPALWARAAPGEATSQQASAASAAPGTLGRGRAIREGLTGRG